MKINIYMETGNRGLNISKARRVFKDKDVRYQTSLKKRESHICHNVGLCPFQAEIEYFDISSVRYRSSWISDRVPTYDDWLEIII
jgi:hypothetical protein